MDPSTTPEVRNLSVADYVVQCLVDCGVTHVFGGHGGAIVPLINSLVAHPDITFVYTRCEVNAALAAAAYAKLKNGLGCCIGTSGPGSSHLTTGLLDAALDRVSVLCLTGMKKSSVIGYSDFQDIRQTEIFRTAGIDYSITIMHKQQVIPIIRDGVAMALTNFTCAHIAIPENIQQEIICPPPVLCARNAGRRTQPTVTHLQYIANAARLIKEYHENGRQLLIAVGQRAVDAGDAILALAELLNSPVVSTQDAKGLVRESHPLVLGVAGIFGNPGMTSSANIIKQTDLVIAFGWDNHSQLLVGADGLQERMMIEFEPAAALVESRFQAMETIVGNIKFCCELLHQMLREGLNPPDTDPVTPSAEEEKSRQLIRQWMGYTAGETPSRENSLNLSLSRCRSLNPPLDRLVDRALTPCGYVSPPQEVGPNYCHPGRLLSQLSTKLEEDAVVCCDVGDVTIWTSLSCCLSKPGQRMLASMRLGTMGYSLCAGMAAVACRPDKQVVIVAGDGGIQMSINELATLRQLGARRVLIIVLVNGVLGRVANEQWGAMGMAHGCEIVNPDFVKLVEAYGGKGRRISVPDVSAIDEALDAALSHEGLFLLELIQDAAVKPCMAKYQAPQEDRRLKSRKYLLDTKKHHKEVVELFIRRVGPSAVEVHQGIMYRPNRNPNYAVTFHGHVDFVIKGTVPREILENQVAAASIRYAFEAGTVLPDNLNSIGEMLTVKGKVFVKNTDKARDDYYTMLTGNSMISPAAGIVTPVDAVPVLTVELNEEASRCRPLAEILASVLQEMQNRPFCAGGRVTFQKLRGTAICKSTVYQEDIFEKSQDYYDPAISSVELTDRTGYVFGFVADFKKPKPGIPYADIRRVLYPGSSGKVAAGNAINVAIHFHVSILKEEFSDVSYSELEPSMFEDIEHLDCSSTVRALQLEVFTIQELPPHIPGISDALPPFSGLDEEGAWHTHSLHKVG